MNHRSFQTPHTETLDPFDFDGVDYCITYAYTPGTHGRSACLPEDWEPPEPSVVEILSIEPDPSDAGHELDEIMDAILREVEQ